MYVTCASFCDSARKWGKKTRNPLSVASLSEEREYVSHGT